MSPGSSKEFWFIKSFCTFMLILFWLWLNAISNLKWKRFPQIVWSRVPPLRKQQWFSFKQIWCTFYSFFLLTARAGICADAFCMLLVFWRSYDWCIVSVHQEKCHQYWPAERSARYQYFVVDPMAEYNMPQYILREFKVTDARVRHQTLGPSSALWFVYYSAYADWVELAGL